MRKFTLLLALSFALLSEAHGQQRSFGRAPWGRGYSTEPRDVGRGLIPSWPLDTDVPRDCFVFARLRYRSWTQRGSYNWYTDYRDSDLNMSFRLQQLTAMRVHPEGTYVDIVDPRIVDYPFYFMSGVGGLEVNEDEAGILRRYMLGGGFIMVDDFHGVANWENFYRALKMIFPDREPIEIPLEHPIFHMVFDLKERYQIPNVRVATPGSDKTWEAPDGKEVHYYGVYDDKGRMVCFIGHNTDVGDGWEEEQSDPFYFDTVSEPKAFPLGINVILYAMTH